MGAYHLVCSDVCVCEFSGSRVYSESLLTSASRSVTRLVQRERHSPSMGGGGWRAVAGFHHQGTNENLPRKSERPIIPFNSVLHGDVRDSELLN